MTIALPLPISDADINEFGKEMDAIYDETIASLGGKDEHYIKRMIRIQRSILLISRIVILASIGFLPTWGLWGAASIWPVFWTTMGLGTFLLGIGKIIENMEIGHNVMHGQWDWMHDPEINSTTWEWDNVCPSDQWKHSHNVVHHTWTNVIGKDRDIGYELLRVNEKQKWYSSHYIQPLYQLVLMLLFEWGIGIHDTSFGKLLRGTEEEKQRERQTLKRFREKIFRQVLKDYVLWPMLAGPYFFYVLGANVIANLIRNIWTNVIIFCGHFPDGVHLFRLADIEGETRAHWYVRQTLGSANISGGKLFHLMTGNLSFQIEHHLFPDMPSNHLSRVAPRVKGACDRYGIPYNSASLARQFGSVTRNIWRFSLPNGDSSPKAA